MNSFKRLWWLGAVAALAACNPFTDTKGGTPVVQEVMASGGSTSDAATTEVTAVDCSVAGACPAGVTAQWLVVAQSTCGFFPDQSSTETPKPLKLQQFADQFVVIAKANKLLDGFSIEQVPQTCVPAGVTIDTPDASWVTVTPYTGATPSDVPADIATETSHWYSCYSPGSPTVSEGAAVVFYRTAKVRDWHPPITEDNPTGAPEIPGDLQETRASWFALGAGIPVSLTDRTTYRLTGNAKDKGGVEMPIDVELRIEPNAGNVEFTQTSVGGTSGAPTLTIDVVKGVCIPLGVSPRYTIEQKVGTGDSATWVDIGESLTGDATVTVTQDFSGPTPVPLGYGNAYTYRLREHITGSATGEEFVRTAWVEDAGDAQFEQAILFAPANPPTFSNLAATSVTVTWDRVGGDGEATEYVVQRALVTHTTTGTPPVDVRTVEPFIDVATVPATNNNAGPQYTYTSTGLDPSTEYEFRILTGNANGTSLPGPSAPVTTTTP